jgi:hypothetical protein
MAAAGRKVPTAFPTMAATATTPMRPPMIHGNRSVSAFLDMAGIFVPIARDGKYARHGRAMAQMSEGAYIEP